MSGQEDRLTLTVQRPAGTKSGDDLPILFWIYGGAFVLGGTNTYDATSFLARAVDQGQRFIMVSVNYGRVLVESPDVMAAKGNLHAVPLMIGNLEDEGSVFAIITPKLTSTDRIVNYLSEYVLYNTSREVIREFVGMYSTRPVVGSPFRTGLLNELYPGFKKMSALIGDAILHFPRRYVLETVSRVKLTLPRMTMGCQLWEPSTAPTFMLKKAQGHTT